MVDAGVLVTSSRMLVDSSIGLSTNSGVDDGDEDDIVVSFSS